MRFSGILARLSRHADLFEVMIRKLGVRDRMLALDDAPSVYRRANMRCLSCSQAEACGQWLETALDPGEAPDYCKNKALFARLERLHRDSDRPDCHGSGPRHVEQAL